MCRFLLKKDIKAPNIVVKCNTLNKASRKLQESIGASITNKESPIENRYYYTVNEDEILQSRCVQKLESLGMDTYKITMDNDNAVYTVKLREGVVKEDKRNFSFVKNIQKMMEKVRVTKHKEVAKPVVNLRQQSREAKTY